MAPGPALRHQIGQLEAFPAFARPACSKSQEKGTMKLKTASGMWEGIGRWSQECASRREPTQVVFCLQSEKQASRCNYIHSWHAPKCFDLGWNCDRPHFFALGAKSLGALRMPGRRLVSRLCDAASPSIGEDCTSECSPSKDCFLPFAEEYVFIFQCWF